MHGTAFLQFTDPVDIKVIWFVSPNYLAWKKPQR